MYKVKKTDKTGFERTMVLNTVTWHSILRSPGVFLPDKYELVIEEVDEPVVTILKPVADEYTQDAYDADVILAKKEPTVEVIERMLRFKPTPYWKGKLNKIK